MATTTQRRPVKTVALGSLLTLGVVIYTIVTFALLIVTDAIAISFTV